MDPAALFSPVSEPDAAAQAAAAEQLGQLAARHGSVGRLGELATWYAACRGDTVPPTLQRARLIVFAGDHGVAARGVVAADPAESVRLAHDLEEGVGPINALARTSGASVRVIDVSLDHAAPGEDRIRRSSPSMDVADTLTAEELERALIVGKRIADQEVDSGADILLPGSLGVGGEVVAAAIVGALTRTEPVAVVGPGYDLGTEIWKHRVAVIRDAMFRVRTSIDQPLTVLQAIGSPDIAALVGFCAQAAVRRTPVLLDDPVTAAAALVADRLAPGARLWFRAAQQRPTPVHHCALRDLGLEPLIDLGVTLGSGAGALAVLPVLGAAVDLLRDTAEIAPGS